MSTTLQELVIGVIGENNETTVHNKVTIRIIRHIRLLLATRAHCCMRQLGVTVTIISDAQDGVLMIEPLPLHPFAWFSSIEHQQE